MVIPGFSAEIKKSMIYNGEKSSCLWADAGLQMVFQQSKEKPQEANICFVQVSDTAGPHSRLPNNATAVSRCYHISSSKKLNTAVTLKIFYQTAEDDIDQLHFLTCTDISPPYNYKILNGGHFTLTYGEITVETFCFYTICRLNTHYSLTRFVLYMQTRLSLYMENVLIVSLYRSYQPTPQKRWNIYLVVTKDNIVSHRGAKRYIQDNYKESVTLVTEQVAFFDHTFNGVTAHHYLRTESPQNISVCEPDHHVLYYADIRHYVDGRPPLLKYSIGYSRNCSFKLRFILDGLHKDIHITLRECDLQGISLFYFVSSQSMFYKCFKGFMVFDSGISLNTISISIYFYPVCCVTAILSFHIVMFIFLNRFYPVQNCKLLSLPYILYLLR